MAGSKPLWPLERVYASLGCSRGRGRGVLRGHLTVSTALGENSQAVDTALHKKSVFCSTRATSKREKTRSACTNTRLI